MHERVHHIQARKAFGPAGGAYAGRLISWLDGEALVDRLSDHASVALVVSRPDRLAAVLRRADISLVETAPLVLVSETYGVLGIATGPRSRPCSSGCGRTSPGSRTARPSRSPPWTRSNPHCSSWPRDGWPEPIPDARGGLGGGDGQRDRQGRLDVDVAEIAEACRFEQLEDERRRRAQYQLDVRGSRRTTGVDENVEPRRFDVTHVGEIDDERGRPARQGPTDLLA